MIKKLLIILFALAVFYFPSFGQSSVHLYDKQHNSQNVNHANKDFSFSSSTTTKLNKKVFGYLPYWEIYNPDLTLRFELLTHIALFDFLLESDGSLTPPPTWADSLDRWQNIIETAQLSDVKVLMTASNLSLTDTDSLLVSNLIKNQSAKNIFFSDVKTIISDYNFDGINLDFENPKLSERGDLMNSFVQELRDSLDNWLTGKELSFATPAVNWGSRWKLKELSEICDYLFIMAYDYHGSWSTNAGPVAPLSGNANFNLYNYETTIENDYAGINPSKLILGVPYYGAEWLVDSNDPYADVIPEFEPNSNWISHVDYADVRYLFYDTNLLTFDGISKSTYFLGQQGDKFKLIWIDSAPMLGLKYDFAIENNLGGIGIWSLGKDGSHPELWNLIEEKFADTTTSVEGEDLVNEFRLYQNYPNPFNPTTTIKFTLPSPLQREGLGVRSVKLVVYNMLGQQVATLVNQKLALGNHEVIFDGSNLPSGVYFYKLTSSKFTQTKKLLMLK